jgi:hypothetical protein
VECIALDSEGGHLLVANLDTLRVVAHIQFTSHRQTCIARGGNYQFDHRFPADQGLAASVLSDVAERPMLDLVPLGCSRRIMADLKRQAGFIS